ncbi:MAG: tetratricopeptide repeat protein [Verrucomicrobiales bacterium]|nr:tetratricopeptide repeat protein [Verrucomicrobiales bacterium]
MAEGVSAGQGGGAGAGIACRLLGGASGWWGLVLAAVLAGGMTVRAQGTDQSVYDAALRDFDVGQWDRAAAGFADLVARFPDTALKAEAVQRERFARAEADLGRGEFARAAEGFSAYAKEYGAQPRAALAVVRAATARGRLGDWSGAVSLLDDPAGPFVARVRAGTEPAVVFSGFLLKAEALRAEKRLPDAEAVLNEAAAVARQPAEQWARLQALLAVQEDAARWEAAAATAEALGQALADGGTAERRAEASARAGRLWLRAGQPERSLAAFSRNTAPEIPDVYQREAVLQLADAAGARGDFAGARERLQAFLTAHPDHPDAAEFNLRLGQILLRQYLASGAATNASPESTALLGLAGAAFDAGLKGTASAETAGLLHLGRGWTAWYESVGGAAAGAPERLRAAVTNFQAAAAGLPAGHSQATARFKLADAQFRLQEPSQALTNYLIVAETYPSDARVQSELVESALQQAVLAAVEARDAAAAGRVVELLLARQPGATTAGDSSLQVAQALSKSGNASGARAVLRRFLRGYPSSPLVADAELSLISLDLRAEDWTNAMTSLERWISVYTNHSSLVQAEFDRAWAAARSGASTNAVAQFAALAARYPTNAIAETASLWLAGHYFSTGDFARAEAACVSVITNVSWQGGLGWHQARLWAAESARRRQSFDSARDWLMTILNDRSTPTNLVPAAYFALGEIRMEAPPAADQPPLRNFTLALEAFTAAAQYTNSPIASAAVGKMADCHLQLASQSTNSYAKAAELYRRVLGSPSADISARSKAACGLAIVARKLAGNGTDAASLALWNESLDRYLDVLDGRLLRPGESPDPWWIKEAGREAGQILEALGRWQDAAALYDRLARELPSQRASWELRAAEARRRLVNGGAPPASGAGTTP